MSEILHIMMALRDQIKLYHWQTLHYPRHDATGHLVDELDKLIDNFVETYMGKYGRPKFTGKIILKNHSDKEAPQVLQDAVEYMTHRLPKLLKSTDTDLLNIRDEIIGTLNKNLYLFTLQ